MRKCIVCGEENEFELKIVEYNLTEKWWMCKICLQNQNDEWEKAKEIYGNLKKEKT